MVQTHFKKKIDISPDAAPSLPHFTSLPLSLALTLSLSLFLNLTDRSINNARRRVRPCQGELSSSTCLRSTVLTQPFVLPGNRALQSPCCGCRCAGSGSSIIFTCAMLRADLVCRASLVPRVRWVWSPVASPQSSENCLSECPALTQRVVLSGPNATASEMVQQSDMRAMQLLNFVSFSLSCAGLTWFLLLYQFGPPVVVSPSPGCRNGGCLL